MSKELKKRKQALEDGYFRKEQEKALKEMASKESSRKCPVCKEALNTVNQDEVEIDICASCGGMWLDKGELEKIIAGKDNSGTKWFEILTDKLSW